MKSKFIIAIIIFLCFIGCNNSIKTQSQNINCFELFSKEFIPTSIDFAKSINDSFNYCITSINDYKNEQVKKGVYIVLLKQYLFQLKEVNHGFDLIDYNNKSAQKIINIYIQLNGLDSTKLYNGGHYGQGLYSHQIYLEALNNKEMLQHKEIKNLVDEISKFQVVLIED